MAKKSPKSTRRARSKKEQTSKKKSPDTKKASAPEREPVIIAEGSDEPVVKAEKSAGRMKPAKTSAKATEPVVSEQAVEGKVEKPHETVVDIDAKATEAQEVIEQDLQPPRHRMLVSAFALGVVVLALLFGSALIRQNNHSETVPSGQNSEAADEILQSGGKMCTNSQATSDLSGSTNPQSVGMTLQTNPSNTIQTPQTLSGGSDAMALQGAACY